eukprot:c19369_g1_i2 orf=248-3073(+)
MASFTNVRVLVERIYKCIKGSSKADYREFTTTCISLARMIDLAVAKNQKLLIVQELPQLLKKVCEQKDNEMFQPAIMVLLMSVKNAICFGWFTTAEGQELLRMSKELVDFFTGMGGWSPIDSNQASQMISKIIPRFYPMLNLQTVIVALEAKPGYEAMVCDFYVLKKPYASEELRMFVIRKDNQDTSSCLVTPNHVNFLVNGKGVEKRSLTSMDMGPQMPSNVTSMLKIGTNLLQIVGDFPAYFLIAIALTTSKTDYSSPLDLQIFNHEGMKAQTDEELIEGPSRVSLLCPISHKRITSPVKGDLCKHHQCFDYNTFMEINSRRPSWRCPYCNRNVSFPDLRLDLQMLKILKDCQGNAVDVMVSEDGSWETLKNEEAPHTNMGAIQMCRKKDRNSANSSGESSTEEGEIRLEKNNSNYIELSDTEDQDRQDHENARHSFAVVNLGGGGGGDRITEDRKPDVGELNSVMGISSTLGQMETTRDGTLLATSTGIAADPSATVPAIPNSQNTNFTVQPVVNEGGGYNVSEGLAERQANREISRSPIAIQALPAQTGTSNPNLRARVRTSSQPNSPAHPSGGVHPIASSSQLGVNQRPLQVQLPSFVGIQDGQVLLNPGQHQQLQLDVPEFLLNSQSLQGSDLRDYRQRIIQHLQQQRTQPFVIPPAGQPPSRVSRDHPYYSATRNVNQIRAADRQNAQQAAALQQTVRPDSPNLLDNQFWQQVRLLQPAQQLQGHLNLGSSASTITREETVSSGLPAVAEGIPMFNQSPSGSGATLRRQTSQNARTVPPQYLPSMNNPLIVPNTSISTRDQRWVTSLDGVPSHADTSSTHLAEQMQRPMTRMRGSITSPVGRDTAVNPSVGLSWLYGGSSQASRFLPGISSSGWSNDAVRHLDPPRSYPGIGTNLQSIQTASTLVSDFDNWLDTQSDAYLAQQGLADFGDLRPG